MFTAGFLFMLTSMLNTQKEFRDALCAVAEDKKSSSQKLAQNLRRAWLRYGSETEDNLRASALISVGNCTGSLGRPTGRCLKIRGKDIDISDVLHQLESCPIPEPLAEVYPNLTPEHWDAITRLVAMTFFVLMEDPTPKNLDTT
jgi:hypothetical protein